MNDRYNKEEFIDLLHSIDIKYLNYRRLKMFNTLCWLVMELNRLEEELGSKDKE